MSDIEQRANFSIHLDLAGASSFSRRLDMNFQPDTLLVNYIQYRSALAEAGVSLIYSDVINNVLGSFQDGFTISSHISFDIRQPIRGSYIFQILNVNDQLITTRNGDLALHLEFIKYKK